MFSLFIVGCTSDEWRCIDGQCIPTSFRCDGATQCNDGTDEIDCHLFGTCSLLPQLIRLYFSLSVLLWRCVLHIYTWEFHGWCIRYERSNSYLILDQNYSLSFTALSPLGCDPGHWLCEDRSTCIALTSVCDDVINCPDRSDEIGCRGTNSLSWLRWFCRFCPSLLHLSNKNVYMRTDILLEPLTSQ